MTAQGLTSASAHATTIITAIAHTTTYNGNDLVNIGRILSKLIHIVLQLELDTNLDKLFLILVFLF